MGAGTAVNCLRALYLLAVDAVKAILHPFDFSDPLHPFDFSEPADALWSQTSAAGSAPQPPAADQPGGSADSTSGVEPPGLQLSAFEREEAARGLRMFARAFNYSENRAWFDTLADKLDPAKK